MASIYMSGKLIHSYTAKSHVLWRQLHIFTKTKNQQRHKNMICRSKTSRTWVAKRHDTPACITADALIKPCATFFFFFSNIQLSAENRCGSQEHFSKPTMKLAGIKDLCIETCFLKKVKYTLLIFKKGQKLHWQATYQMDWTQQGGGGVIHM